MKTITCRCDKSFEADIPEELDLDQEPEALDAILEGNFLVMTCPHCGERIKPEVPIEIASRRRGLALKVVAEAERSSWMEGMRNFPDGVDVIVGYAELYERALIIRDGLDARAIEILKYYILAKAMEGIAESGDTPLVRYRGRSEDSRLSFGIEGLRQDEVALLALPFDRYEKALRDMPAIASSEPFSAFLFGPYKSIRALENL